MIQRTIKYTDFNGVEREEDFYFHLSLNEMMDMETKNPDGSLSKKLEGIINNKDVMGVLDSIKWVIEKAYGVRTENGRSFKKSPELTEEFMQSAAYEQLYLDLLDDPEETAKFMNALVPKRIPKIFQDQNPAENTPKLVEN